MDSHISCNVTDLVKNMAVCERGSWTISVEGNKHQLYLEAKKNTEYNGNCKERAIDIKAHV